RRAQARYAARVAQDLGRAPRGETNKPAPPPEIEEEDRFAKEPVAAGGGSPDPS
ncbi:MAG: hypothetical protein QOE31_3759, partial [Solirubrobacteraceae bacterium]|nr:hypothetical protein [Solirubrobacteraceae bacterium]